MSKKPTITIRYPEASEKALKLTEAMVKRSPGKRVVETESEDPIFPDGGDLFSSFIHCKTQTGVDLTLTLNPSSMDFALETLIRPNLNAEERKQILGEDVEQEQAELGLGDGAQAAQAPGQALDGGSSPDVPSAEQEAATQSGEQETPVFSYRTYAIFGLIMATIDIMPSTKKTMSLTNFLKSLAYHMNNHLQKNLQDYESFFFAAYEAATEMLDQTPAIEYADPIKMAEALEKELYDEDHEAKKSDPSWDDVEKEARTIGQKPEPPSEPSGEEPSAPAEKSAAPLADGDIDPGLLNDIEDKKEGEEE